MNRLVYSGVGSLAIAVILVLSVSQCSSGPDEEEDCGDIQLEAENYSPIVGDSVRVEATTERGEVEEYLWLLKNYAGKVIDSSALVSPAFKMDSVGAYSVYVRLDNTCADSLLLNVLPADEPPKDGAIKAPNKIIQGRSYEYAYEGPAPDEEQLEWFFGEGGDVGGIGRVVDYAYEHTGPKNIRAIYEGKILAERTVRVSPPPGQKQPSYTPQEFKKMLQQIADSDDREDKNAVYEKLKKSLRDENILVTVNGQAYQFFEYYIDLSLSSGTTISSVELDYSDTGITGVTIKQ